MKISQIYIDGTYWKNNPTWGIEYSPWKTQQILAIMARNRLKPQTVADVGCGAGEVLNLLSRKIGRNIKFTGYEISPQAHKLCQKIHNPQIKFKLQDILQEKVYYDLILSLDVIEHVEDYYDYLRRLKTKAKYKIFNIPLDISVQTVIRENQTISAHRIRTQVGHLHHFTKNLALDVLRQAGHEILDYHYGIDSVDLPPRNRKILLLKPIRKIAYTVNPDLAARVLGGTSLIVLTK